MLGHLVLVFLSLFAFTTTSFNLSPGEDTANGCVVQLDRGNSWPSWPPIIVDSQASYHHGSLRNFCQTILASLAFEKGPVLTIISVMLS